MLSRDGEILLRAREKVTGFPRSILRGKAGVQFSRVDRAHDSDRVLLCSLSCEISNGEETAGKGGRGYAESPTAEGSRKGHGRKMRRLLLWTHFLLLTVLLAPVQRVAACSCAPAHPQTKFCDSDFVAVVRVKKVLTMSEYEIAYKVKINRVFKSNPKADTALMQNLLWTPSEDSMCGVILKVGETYVLNGRIVNGRALISFCGLTIRWADTTSRQRKGLRQLYQQGCVCDILYTHWRRKGAVLESSGGKRCLWESTPGPQDCQEKYGVCMVAPSGCSWVPSVPYKNCIKEHQRLREQQRAREP